VEQERLHTLADCADLSRCSRDCRCISVAGLDAAKYKYVQVCVSSGYRIIILSGHSSFPIFLLFLSTSVGASQLVSSHWRLCSSIALSFARSQSSSEVTLFHVTCLTQDLASRFHDQRSNNNGGRAQIHIQETTLASELYSIAVFLFGRLLEQNY
jgi:hypothetical protein